MHWNILDNFFTFIHNDSLFNSELMTECETTIIYFWPAPLLPCSCTAVEWPGSRPLSGSKAPVPRPTVSSSTSRCLWVVARALLRVSIPLTRVFCPLWDLVTVSPVSLRLQGCPAIIATFYDSKAQLVMGVFVGTGALLVSPRAACCTFRYLSSLSRKFKFGRNRLNEWIILLQDGLSN